MPNDELVVLLLLVADDPSETPIFDEVLADHEAAKDAGYEWHPHWRLEQSWAAFAEDEWLAEQEAEHYGNW
jgi:hypothetical protein